MILNLLIFVFIFSNIIVKGIASSDNGIYKCPEVGSFADLGPHFKNCNFKEFLLDKLFWLPVIFLLTFTFSQPGIIISSLISYYLIHIFSKKFEKIERMNFFIKLFIFLFLNFIILLGILYFLLVFYDFPPDQL